MSARRPLFLAGEFVDGETEVRVWNPFDGKDVARVAAAARSMAERAVAAAVEGFEVTRLLPAFERAAILARASAGIAAAKDEIARTITAENGKPIKWSRVEVDRAVHTFHAASGEAERLGGDVVPLDVRAGLEGAFGIVRRVPVGPVLAISPFNFPLNLVAHKLAPAIAAGCSIVLKPASRTPLTALLLARVLAESGLPKGALSVLPCSREVGDVLVADERFRVVSFTGSADVGFGIKARAGKKPAVLELGGNAAVIVHSDADLDRAAERCAIGAFAYAGQVCISVQRVLVHESVHDAFTSRLVERTRSIGVGDPSADSVDVGPMIDDDNAARIEGWIAEARAGGANVWCGGTRSGRLVAPAVLSGVPDSASLAREEAFGPTVDVSPYARLDDAIAAVNRSRFGLQAGVFTSDLEVALRAFDGLDVGGLILNDAPTFRVDTMPYGGVKDSGLGREGVAYAIEHFTERKLLAIHRTRGDR